MAKTRLDKDQIAPKDIFKNIEDGAVSADEKVKLLNKSLKMLQEAAKSIKTGMAAAGTPKDTKSIKDVNQKMREANELAKAKLNIDKQIIQEKIKIQELNKQQNKQIRTEVQATQELTNEQKKNLGTLEKIQLRNQKLRAERAKLNLSTRQGKQRLREINAELDRNNTFLKRTGDAMKQQRMNVGNYKSALSGLKNVLGQLGLAFGVFRLIRDSFNVIKDFEQSQANLASVLGRSVDELGKLTDQAKELGASTTFTASQVAELQLELAKLGFEDQQILEMTDATLKLAEATGTELARAAEVTGATLRGFGLEATQTKRITDVMAASFSKSSLDMEKFATAMSTVAPVANLAGKTIEETTALIGTLTDRGIDASTAGTGLRNMFLSANKAGISFDEALQQINNSSDKMATSLELFGKRGASIGVVLAKNQQSTKALSDQLKIAGEQITEDNFLEKVAESGISFDEAMQQVRDAQDKGAKATEIFGAELSDLAIKFAKNNVNAENLTETFEKQRDAAEKMAETQRNTLGGSIALLRSAWEGLILKMDQAGGVGEKIRAGIRFLANNLETILAVLQRVVTAFVAFKLAMKALKLQENIRNFRDMQKQLGDTAKGLKSAQQSAKAFGMALKGIALSAAITVLVELGMALWDIASGAAQAREDMARLNAQLERSATMAADKIDDLRKRTKKAIDEQRILLADRTISDKQFLEFTKELIQANEAELKGWIKSANAKKQGYKDLKDELQPYIDAVMEQGATEGAFDMMIAKSKELAKELGMSDWESVIPEDVMAQLDANIAGVNKRLKAYHDELENVDAALVENTIETKNLNHATADGAKHKKKINTEISDQVKLLKDLNDEYKEYSDTWDEILGIRADAQIKAITIEIDDQIEALKRQQELGNLVTIAETDPVIELMNQRKEMRIKAIEEERDAIIKADREENRQRFEELRANLEKEKQEKIKGAEGNAAAIKKIEANAQKELEEIDLLEISAADTLAAKEIKAKEDANNKIIDIERKTGEEINDIRQDIADKNSDITEKNAQEELAIRKEQAELENAIIKGVTDYFIAQADKRIAKIEEEIEAAQRHADFLREAAAQGNITAKESLAEQNRLIAQANAEKQMMEERKQRILFVSSILQAYNSNLAAGDDSTTAFTKAITSSELLGQALTSLVELPTFFEGTEDTGKHGTGIDGKGGFLSVLHPNERVLTKEQNKKIGGFSNNEVAQIMEQYRLGEYVDGSQVNVGWDNHILVERLLSVEDKLDQVNNTIKHKPDTKIEAGKIIGGTMQIIENTKKGNQFTQRRFKVSAK